jgi:hypothetical protein
MGAEARILFGTLYAALKRRSSTVLHEVVDLLACLPSHPAPAVTWKSGPFRAASGRDRFWAFSPCGRFPVLKIEFLRHVIAITLDLL